MKRREDNQIHASRLSIYEAAREAAPQLGILSDRQRSAAILRLAALTEAHADRLLRSNAMDLKAMDPADAKYDRLLLTEARIQGITASMRMVASQASPIGATLEKRTLPNGLRLRRVSVPLGVVGVIFEARPNVMFDLFSLLIKSGNVGLFKGSSHAVHTNRYILSLIHAALNDVDISTASFSLLPTQQVATDELITATDYVDVVIPRGGKLLIRYIRQNSHVPCIETGAGVVHAYVDHPADIAMAQRIVYNAKTRRPAVCNSLDTLLVHEQMLSQLPAICAPLAQAGVVLHADEAALSALSGHYPSPLLKDDALRLRTHEFMSLEMNVLTVSGVVQAIGSINRYGSHHSDAIVTSVKRHAHLFQQLVNSACVYVNAPTSFSDGGEFALGAEVGISTQKLHARGPMGLSALTSYKWLIEGEGQVRNS